MTMMTLKLKLFENINFNVNIRKCKRQGKTERFFNLAGILFVKLQIYRFLQNLLVKIKYNNAKSHIWWHIWGYRYACIIWTKCEVLVLNIMHKLLQEKSSILINNFNVEAKYIYVFSTTLPLFYSLCMWDYCNRLFLVLTQI